MRKHWTCNAEHTVSEIATAKATHHLLASISNLLFSEGCGTFTCFTMFYFFGSLGFGVKVSCRFMGCVFSHVFSVVFFYEQLSSVPQS